MTCQLTEVKLFFWSCGMWVDGEWIPLKVGARANAHLHNAFGCLHARVHRVHRSSDENLCSECRSGLRMPGRNAFCPFWHRDANYKLLTLNDYLLNHLLLCLTTSATPYVFVHTSATWGEYTIPSNENVSVSVILSESHLRPPASIRLWYSQHAYRRQINFTARQGWISTRLLLHCIEEERRGASPSGRVSK